jgi:alkylation response protein AidB-like acyl-CoA dehydrogenase
METGLNFDYDEDQDAMRAAVDRFCTQQNVRDIARQSGAPFPLALWRQLAELGAFSVVVPGDAQSGGALAMCAINETLGQHLFPGPLAATYIALQVLEPEPAAGVVDGQLLVSLGSVDSTLLPWGPDADIFLLVEGTNIARAHIPDFIEPLSTLGGEIWGRAQLKADEPFHDASRGLVVGNIATATYLVGAAWRLLLDTCEHAATRKQFGKTLGEFQAVSHPLADCAIALSGAQSLARAAACAFDQSTNHPDAAAQPARQAAGALFSARRAALNTAFACHQVFGGIGITLEGPAFHVSRRIRQVASTPPVGCRERELLLAASGLGA